MLRVAYGQKGAKWKELTDTVTYFIAKDYLPIYIYVQLGKMILLSLEAIPPTPSYTREHLPTLGHTPRLGHTLTQWEHPTTSGHTLPH